MDTTLTTQADLTDALTDLFGLDLGLIPADDLHRLWERAHAAHLAWESAGRP